MTTGALANYANLVYNFLSNFMINTMPFKAVYLYTRNTLK